jgi:hypothetical protein
MPDEVTLFVAIFMPTGTTPYDISQLAVCRASA